MAHYIISRGNAKGLVYVPYQQACPTEEGNGWKYWDPNDGMGWMDAKKDLVVKCLGTVQTVSPQHDLHGFSFTFF